MIRFQGRMRGFRTMCGGCGKKQEFIRIPHNRWKCPWCKTEYFVEPGENPQGLMPQEA